MELVSFILLVVVSMGFTIWLGNKKDWHAIFATASYSFFIVGIIMLNADPMLSIPMSTIACTYVEGNSTWNANCDAYDHTVTYTLDPTVLTIVNILVFIGVLFVMLIGYERFRNL